LTEKLSTTRRRKREREEQERRVQRSTAPPEKREGGKKGRGDVAEKRETSSWNGKKEKRRMRRITIKEGDPHVGQTSPPEKRKGGEKLPRGQEGERKGSTIRGAVCMTFTIFSFKEEGRRAAIQSHLPRGRDKGVKSGAFR